MDVPSDMVRRILFLLNPEDLQSECRSNKYISSICQDNNFFREYIQRNFDPIKYDLEKWDNSIFENYLINPDETIINWKLVFKRLVSKKNILVKLYMIKIRPPRSPDEPIDSYKEYIKDINIPIYFSDSIKNIVLRLLDHLNELNMGIDKIVFIFKINQYPTRMNIDINWLKKIDNVYIDWLENSENILSITDSSQNNIIGVIDNYGLSLYDTIENIEIEVSI